MRAAFVFVPLALLGAYALHARTDGAERHPTAPPASTTGATRFTDYRSEAIHIRGGATATVSISLDGSLDLLRRELESKEGASELDLERLSLSGDLLADLAASLDAYLEIETNNGRRVLVAHLGSRGRVMH
ncbi:MAG: hypothetical protein PVF27_05530 [Gemmatimonadales bacterium]|jgi:hypothetical protein